MHAFDVRGFRHGLKRCLIEIVGIDFREAAIRSAKVPTPEKRSAMSLAPRHVRKPGRERFLTGLGCLQECAWRGATMACPWQALACARDQDRTMV